MTRAVSIPDRQLQSLSRLTWANVSPLGLGTVKFGRNTSVKYPGGEGFALPSDPEIEALLDLALDCGINLIDTAPAYGIAEDRLGQLLGVRREKFFLVTKTGEEFDGVKSQYIFHAAHTRMSVERSLKRLKTDYIDAVLVHSNRDDAEVLKNSAVLETLALLKDEGKIGSFGASTYSIEGGRLAVDLSDCVMVAYNKTYTDERSVIDYAYEKGKAVLVKKGLASGHIGGLGDLGDNIRFVTETPGVTSLVFGSLKPDNILANVRALGRKAV
jgi:aryl-alcohol dehydrogenase-like predicted oxidoreductase